MCKYLPRPASLDVGSPAEAAGGGHDAGDEPAARPAARPLPAAVRVRDGAKAPEGAPESAEGGRGIREELNPAKEGAVENKSSDVGSCDKINTGGNEV